MTKNTSNIVNPAGVITNKEVGPVPMDFLTAMLTCKFHKFHLHSVEKFYTQKI